MLARKYLLFSILLLATLSSGYNTSEKKQSDSLISLSSYQDIPGVTDEEIAAIETLKKQGASFTYGMESSTEAFLNADGEIKGYSALICEWLSRLFGISFTPKIYPQPALLEGLENGSIDFTGDLTANDERRKTYYMTDPIIHRPVKVMRIKDSPSPGEIALSRPVRYVFMEGDTIINSVTAASAPGSYKAAAAGNHESVYQMLNNGEADAFIGTNIAEAAFDPYGSVVTEDFLPLIDTPVSLAAHAPALAPIISVVTKALAQGAYKHLTELYRQGYRDYRKNKFLAWLSDEERTYIRNTPVIPFAAQFMSYPVSFYNTNEGKWEGIIFDILDEMKRLTGLEFKLVNDEKMDLPELMNLLENGTAYIMPNLIQSDERRKRFIWPDAVYLSDRFALLSKRSYPNIELSDIPFARVGFAKGSAFGDLFRSWFPNALHAIEFPGTDDAFMALERGEVDLVMSSLSRLAALTHYYELSDYKANYLFSTAFDASFGLNKDQTVLCSIINKMLPLIDTGRIVEQWMSRTYNIETMRLRKQQPWLIGLSALFFSVLFLIAVFFAKSRRSNKHLEILVGERTYDLRLQTAKLKAIFDFIPDIVFCKDLDLKFTQCNKVTEEYSGINEKDIIGTNYDGPLGFSADVAETLLETERVSLRENRKVMTEETVTFPNNLTRTFEVIRVPFLLNNVIVGILGIAHDITNRKEMELELERKNTIMNAVIANYRGIIWSVDTNGVITTFNGQYLKTLGVTPSFLEGKNIALAKQKNRHPDIIENIEKTLRDGPQEWISDINGSMFRSYTTQQRDSNGNVVGVVGSTNDESEMFKLQRELESALEAAKITSQTKSNFLANMSHEIRTPMNAILGVTEILIQNETLPKDIENGLGKIYNSCNLLLGIINDILDFSKIEAGKLDIMPAEYKLASLINDSVHLNMMRIDSKPIEFELQVDENIPAKLIGDEIRIKQILNNLLSNAFKYTDAGKVTLSVAYECGPDNGAITLVLSVRDSGHGMTEEQLGKMFEEYSRFNREKNIAVEGTGLGLAITQRLVNLMNGKIHVESEPDKGSLFTVRLPQETVDVEILGKEMVANLRLFRMNYMTHRKRSRIARDPMPYGSILIVDDVETNLYVAVGLMKLYRLQIDTAMSGSDAIDKIKDGKVYDIVFIDHMMPDMDGIETAKQLRSLGYASPIIALTANAVAGQADMFLQNGFDEFISKPIDIRQLNTVLNKFVRDKQTPEVIEAARRQKYSTETNSDTTTLLQESFIRDALKTVTMLEELSQKPSQLESEENLRRFTISVHGIKSSLENIGESKLAESARRLEQASRDRNTGLIATSTPSFLNELRILLEKIKPKSEEDCADEDIGSLQSKLQAIRDICDDYDRKGALSLLAGIKNCSKKTRAALDRIKEHILHSDFDEAKSMAAAYAVELSQTGTGILNKKVDGLNIAKGLERYNDDERTYLKVLRTYAANVRSMLDSIETADKAQPADYERAVHSIKGTSLDIFAEQVGKKAMDLENAARAGDFDYIRKNNPALLEAARKLVSDIEALLFAIDAENPMPKKARPDSEMLSKLLAACKAYDMDGADAAMAEIEKYKYESDDGLADWLRESVDMMNFAQIVQKLSKLDA
jgi:PAS domain S-box-containing protein